MNRHQSKLSPVGQLLLCTSIFSIALGDVVVAQPQPGRAVDTAAKTSPKTSPKTAPTPLSSGLPVVGGVLLLSVLIEQYRRWCYLSLEPTALEITAPSPNDLLSKDLLSNDLKSDPSSGSLSI
jgi:hypothetical protein